MAVDVAQTAASSDLKQIFQKVNAQSCPRYFNFHMHTVYSDGKLQPEDLIQQALTIGLRELAITDHHTIGGYQAAACYLEQLKASNLDIEATAPRIWTGVEINASLLDVEVHILGYAFEYKHASILPYLQRKITTGQAYQAENAIAAIHQAGGIAVLAHPVRYKRSPFELIPAAAALGIDGVETFYAYNNPKPWQPSVKETDYVQQLASEHHLLSTCGTDTHGLSLLQRL